METKENIKFYFGIITAVLAILIIAGGFILAFIRYRKRMTLQQQELFRLDAQHKKNLLLSNIESVESERMRIAKDIHDEIGSIFSTLSLSVSQLQPGSTISAEILESNHQLITMGIDGVRRIAHSIIPFELELLGLYHALEQHFDKIARLSAIEVQFNSSSNIDRIKPNAALAIYRIIQELTSNSIKYAMAKSICFSITQKEDSLKLVYTDDGVGTRIANTGLQKGIGLKNIESRVILLEGTVRFQSEPGGGFSCTIVIPQSQNTIP